MPADPRPEQFKIFLNIFSLNNVFASQLYFQSVSFYLRVMPNIHPLLHGNRKPIYIILNIKQTSNEHLEVKPRVKLLTELKF